LSFPRGAVVLVAYPNSDLRSFKKRPALVVQAEHVITGLAQTVLALITSNLARTGPTRVRVLRNSEAGSRMRLLVDSVIVCDTLQTVSTDAIVRTIGVCPVMNQVDSALRTTLSL
jgi:mRNA interferase MazF